MDVNFTVLNQDDTPEDLTCYEAHQGKETLGVFLCPDRNNNDAFKALAGKAKKWRDNLRSGHLQPNLAWQAFRTTIMKTLEYPLVVLMSIEAEYEYIMDAVLCRGAS